ncbi:MAG TPA: futalosine hydrolase [Trueperaceae bacterium]|nr:futalosine hydrolase [Trueperaceae bacterium]
MVAATRLETEPLVGALTDAGRPPWATRWPWAVSGGLDGVPVVLAATGLGKANAAAAVAALVAGSGGAVRAVVQVGVGGAYPGAVVPVGAAALADSELDLDLGLGRHPDWEGLEALAVPGDATRNLLDLSGPALEAASAATGLRALPFATSDAVTADAGSAAYLARRFGVAVESMEGVGAARAAAALGVPFVEVRGVSNAVGERDKAAWRLRDAVAAACDAARAAVVAVWEVSREPAS